MGCVAAHLTSPARANGAQKREWAKAYVAADPTLSRAEALRKTLLALIDKGEAKLPDGRPAYAYAHPLFWAPFMLVGDGS